MNHPPGSITELARMVEGLAVLLRQKFGPAGVVHAAAPDPRDFMVDGIPLPDALMELWPKAGGFLGPGLSEAGVEGLLHWRRQAVVKAEEDLVRRRDWNQRALRRLGNERQAWREWLAVEQARVTTADQRVSRLREMISRLNEIIRLGDAEVAELDHWLQGVTPWGLKGFKDQHGRLVEAARLKEANQRWHQIQVAADQNRLRLNALNRKLIQAEAGAVRARERFEDSMARARKHLRAISVKSRDLEKISLELNESGGMGGAETALRKARIISLLHSRIIRQAAARLTPVLSQPGPTETADPHDSVEASMELANKSLKRLGRLEGLLIRQKGQLERAAGRVGPALKEQRAINREISRMQAEFPVLLEPLLDGATATPQARRKAAAGISVLAGRAEELLPKAEQAQAALEEVRLMLDIGLERGRLWTEAWREAGKSERNFVKQAQAQVEEFRLATDKAQMAATEAMEGLAQVMEALAPLCLLDLLPTMAAAAKKISGLRRHAGQMKLKAAALEAKPPATHTPNLAKPPLALKPYSTSLRRLSGKRVEVGELRALYKAAAHWANLAAGPLAEEIKRPAEEVALRLSASLARVAAHHQRVKRERDQKIEDASVLSQQLATEREISHIAQDNLASERRLNDEQGRQLMEYEAELVVVRQEAAQVPELRKRLSATSESAHRLAGRLEHTQRLAQALKAKSLERHRLYSKAKYAVEWLDYWRERALNQEQMLLRAKAELDTARKEHQAALANLREATAGRDEALRKLAKERAARARQALDLLGGKALSVELAASQSEAGRWASLAQNLSLALAVKDQKHGKETAALRAQLDDLASEAATLRRHLERIADLVEEPGLDDQQPPPPGGAARRPAMNTAQVYHALDTMGRARRRLQGIGRTAVGQWAMVAALAGGLVLVPPGTPSKATRTDSPLRAPRPEIQSTAHQGGLGPSYQVPVQAGLALDRLGRSGVELNLLPLRGEATPLPPQTERQIEDMAQKAGLSPQVLISSARAVFSEQSAVEPAALEELAQTARSLAQRHPLIFKELSKKALPANAAQVAALTPAVEKAQHLFLDRLYREYRTLGFEPEEALGALAANQRAAGQLAKAWPQKLVYAGKVKPVPEVEALELKEFVGRITPYMQSRLMVFMRQRKLDYTGDLETYAKNLAFDMYCAAKRFQVPVTFLLAIAHQETWYANVLGDVGRSASPFQIYEPTRALIRSSMRECGFIPPPKGVRLERHLTMATYMAAFHLRELMERALRPAKGKKPARVQMDTVLLRYNGSPRYASQVAVRQAQLAKFLRQDS